MSAEFLQSIDSILDEAESSLNGFVVAMERKLCHAAWELIRDAHKHLTEAHALLMSVDDAPDSMVLRYTEMISGLEGAQMKYKRSCKPY